MLDRDLEHPDVTAIQRDGYAHGHGPRVVSFCSECGKPIHAGEKFLHVRKWGCICEDCVDSNWEEINE